MPDPGPQTRQPMEVPPTPDRRVLVRLSPGLVDRIGEWEPGYALSKMGADQILGDLKTEVFDYDDFNGYAEADTNHINSVLHPCTCGEPSEPNVIHRHNGSPCRDLFRVDL